MASVRRTKPEAEASEAMIWAKDGGVWFDAISCLSAQRIRASAAWPATRNSNALGTQDRRGLRPPQARVGRRFSNSFRQRRRRRRESLSQQYYLRRTPALR